MAYQISDFVFRNDSRKLLRHMPYCNFIPTEYALYAYIVKYISTNSSRSKYLHCFLLAPRLEQENKADSQADMSITL